MVTQTDSTGLGVRQQPTNKHNYAVEMYLLTQNINIFDYYEASHLSEVQFIILLPVQFPLSICLSSG